MATELITITEYCIHHRTEVSFIDELEQSGLIHIIQQDEERCIDYDQLDQLESYTRWYQDLDINVAGIETIHHLLQKIGALQQQVRTLEAGLSHYEAGA
ncbi:chaperone modulator CbpM [Taibaiella koreensis]|uniref:chaperone modulator CbpM n=1 Tax=Taibaiella koreensis TaxID=1268548 RepID=UPI000E59FC40|nr:chaperone modulator CbpM [Taibaiella koreensis]